MDGSSYQIWSGSNSGNISNQSADGALAHMRTLVPEDPGALESNEVDVFELIDPDVDDQGVEAESCQMSSFQRAVAFDDEHDLPGFGDNS